MFVNCNDKQLDVLIFVDSFYDELYYKQFNPIQEHVKQL